MYTETLIKLFACSSEIICMFTTGNLEENGRGEGAAKAQKLQQQQNPACASESTYRAISNVALIE